METGRGAVGSASRCAVVLPDRTRSMEQNALATQRSIRSMICLTAQGPTAVWRHSGIGAGRSVKFGLTQNEYREWTQTTQRQLLWEEDGRESAVGIIASDSLAFIVNGKSDGNAISDAATQIMLGVIGAFQHPNPSEP